MTIPICAVTGLIAGDADACGDCDPCLGAHAVPDVVKRLLAEKEGWRTKYGDTAADCDAIRAACQPFMQYLADIKFNLRKQPRPHSAAIEEAGERNACVTWEQFYALREALGTCGET